MKVVNKAELLRKREVPLSPDGTIRDPRASFAEGMAAAAFGRNRPHPDSYSFVDRAPGAIAIFRAERWPGAGR